MPTSSGTPRSRRFGSGGRRPSETRHPRPVRNDDRTRRVRSSCPNKDGSGSRSRDGRHWRVATRSRNHEGGVQRTGRAADDVDRPAAGCRASPDLQRPGDAAGACALRVEAGGGRGTGLVADDDRATRPGCDGDGQSRVRTGSDARGEKDELHLPLRRRGRRWRATRCQAAEREDRVELDRVRGDSCLPVVEVEEGDPRSHSHARTDAPALVLSPSAAAGTASPGCRTRPSASRRSSSGRRRLGGRGGSRRRPRGARV